jgi:hypothetical protein
MMSYTCRVGHRALMLTVIIFGAESDKRDFSCVV